MNYAAIKTCDIANGPGVRTSLFVSGCTHHCKGCFQPETWDFSYGEPFTQDVIDTILHSLEPAYVAGLTLLGGEPRLGFLVTGGNMDSMVNHYSVGRHRRRTDAYTPGGVTGKRPDYATVVYCNLIRRSFPKIPILIGGIEASLRRLAHYDYWSDSLKRSILLDSQADLLLYGMGERLSLIHI